MSKLGHVGRLFGEFFAFAMHNKIYWIVPLVVVLALMGVLIVAGQGMAPFIYTLF